MFRLVFSLACAAALGPALAIPARADDLKTFLSDTQRFTAMRSFKLQIDTTAPGGSSSKFLTYVAPNKLRVDVPAQKIAVVVIGKLVWLRGPDGKWRKERMAPGADPLAAVHDASVVAAQIKGESVTFLGKTDLGGVPTHLYRIDAPKKRGFKAKTTRIWIGTGDGFPRKIVQQNGPYSSTATYTDLNGALSISGP